MSLGEEAEAWTEPEPAILVVNVFTRLNQWLECRDANLRLFPRRNAEVRETPAVVVGGEEEMKEEEEEAAAAATTVVVSLSISASYVHFIFFGLIWALVVEVLL